MDLQLLEQPPLLEQLGLPQPPLLEQLEPSLPPLKQLEMLDSLLLLVELDPLLDTLDLLLLRCWSSYAAKSEKEESEVLCVCVCIAWHNGNFFKLSNY
jgi:hypothetical protein